MYILKVLYNSYETVNKIFNSNKIKDNKLR